MLASGQSLRSCLYVMRAGRRKDGIVIWSKLGFLVAVFVFGCSVVVNLLTNRCMGSENCTPHALREATADVASGKRHHTSGVGKVASR